MQREAHPLASDSGALSSFSEETPRGGILDSVAAVVIGLPMLGGIPKLAPQAFCAI